MAGISIAKLCKAFGSVMAVKDLDLEIAEGEFVSLIGPSGCGKSTLGRVLLRLQEATAGQVYFEGRDLLALNTGELRAMREEEAQRHHAAP